MTTPHGRDARLYVEPPPSEVPTLEAMWETYGPWLQAYARRAFGDDPGAVDACCRAVMVRAGEELLETLDSPTCGADLSWWLQRLADQAIAEIRCSGVDPAWTGEEPLPHGLPRRLRAMLRLRASTEAASAALGHNGAAGPIGRAVLDRRRRWREGFEHFLRDFPAGVALGTVRSWWRRTETALSPLASAPGSGVNVLVGGAGLSQAAALLTAVAVGIMAPAPAPPATADLVAVPVAERGPAAAPVVEAPRRGGAGSSPTLAVPQGGDEAERDGSPVESYPAPETPPSDPNVDPTSVAVAPRVAASPDRMAQEPVEENEHEGGTEFSTADGRVTLDVEGDGDDEASAPVPYGFVDCPKPEDRGPVTAAACPVLEQSGS